MQSIPTSLAAERSQSLLASPVSQSTSGKKRHHLLLPLIVSNKPARPGVPGAAGWRIKDLIVPFHLSACSQLPRGAGEVGVQQLTAQQAGWSSLVLYLQQTHSLAPQPPTCLGKSQISVRQFSILSFKWISLYPCPHPHLQAPKEVPDFPALVLNDTMSRCHCHLLRGAEN